MPPLDCLRRYPLFNLLTARRLDAWLAGGQELAFATGETVFQEGSAGVWAYLVLDGRVRVLRRSPAGREITLGLMGPGQVFGEYALLPPFRNTATCRAAGPARLLRLPLLPLPPLLAALPGVGPNLKNWLRLHALLGYLRDQPFLGFMSAPSALAFLDRVQPAAFRALRTVQAEGLGGDRWYYVESGQVALNPPPGGADEPPRELGPGDCFGERALLGQGELPVAVALTDVRCLCLARDAFAGRPDRGQDVSHQSLRPQVSAVRQAYAWVGQREESDCGVAALAMVLQFHGRAVPVETVRQRVSVGPGGATLLELQRAAVASGLRAQAVRVEADQLGQVALPAIAHLRGGHYVVVYELRPEGAVVGDPGSGIVRVSRALFDKDCSGKLLLVYP